MVVVRGFLTTHTPPTLDIPSSTPTLANKGKRRNAMAQHQQHPPFHYVPLLSTIHTNATTLVVYDFDNTLFHSPSPNPYLYQRPLSLNEIGWYRHPATLQIKNHNAQWFNQTLLQTANNDLKDTNKLAIVLTGRTHEGYHDTIRKILDSQELKFKVVILKETPIQRTNYKFKYDPGTTFGFKIECIDYILRNFSSIRKIEVYEDRLGQVKQFEEHLERWRTQRRVDSAICHHIKDKPPGPLTHWGQKDSEGYGWFTPQEEIDMVQRMAEEGQRYELQVCFEEFQILLDEESTELLLRLCSSDFPSDWQKRADKLYSIQQPEGRCVEDQFASASLLGEEAEFRVISKGITADCVAITLTHEPTSSDWIACVASRPDTGRGVLTQITNWSPFKDINTVIKGRVCQRKLYDLMTRSLNKRRRYGQGNA